MIHPTTGDPTVPPPPGTPPATPPRRTPPPVFLTVPRARRGILWWLGWLIPVIAAHRVCSPTREGRVVDRVIDGVRIGRMVLGLLLTVGAWWYFELVPVREMPAQFYRSFAYGFTAVLFNVYVAWGIIAMTPRGRKWAAVALWRGPFLAFFLTAASIVLKPADLTRWPYWSSPWAVAYGMWALAFSAYGGLLLILNGGRVADINDALPALVPFFTVLAVVLPSMGDPMYDKVSMPMRLVLGLTGPVTLVLLARWELRRLRTRHGVRLSDTWLHV